MVDPAAPRLSEKRDHALVDHHTAMAPPPKRSLRRKSSIQFLNTPTTTRKDASIESDVLIVQAAGITAVDAVSRSPGFPNDWDFFGGEQYVRLTVTPCEIQNTFVFGPASVEKH